MCEGIRFTYRGRQHTSHFPKPTATLPVVTRTGKLSLVTWGRHPQQSGELPLGACVRLEAIRAGRWDSWFPKPVRVAYDSFMLRDVTGTARWYDSTTSSEFLQGLLARDGYLQRVYLVMLETDSDGGIDIYEHWPRIVTSLKQAQDQDQSKQCSSVPFTFAARE